MIFVHPFNDGNGRMSRLLTTLLLYRNGYVVRRYISWESKFAKNKDLYYDTLEECQKGWDEGPEDISPFIISTILVACRDFEERVSLISAKLPANEMVRRAAYGKINRKSCIFRSF